MLFYDIICAEAAIIPQNINVPLEKIAEIVYNIKM